MRYSKMTEIEAEWIDCCLKAGYTISEISKGYGYKYMDVYNIKRGNAFNSITGNLQVPDMEVEKVIEISLLLKQGYPYRYVAYLTETNANVVRNIRGYLVFKGEL